MSPSASDSVDQQVVHVDHVSNPNLCQIHLDNFPPSLTSHETLVKSGFANGVTFENREPEFQLSPETTTDDGIFLPGSRYQALHNTLRNQVFLTAQSAEPSREASPSRNELSSFECSDQNIANQPPGSFTLGGAAGSEVISDANIVLTAHQEYILWKNWVDEISAWVSQPKPHCCFAL